ncbi:MAG: hypothetical protein V8Q05_03665 [Lachnospiraceae bacterium]
MLMVFAIGTLNLKAKAQEIADYNEATTSVVVKNEGFGNDYRAQPLTTMFDCEIILAFTLDGLEMTFTTSCPLTLHLCYWREKILKFNRKCGMDGKQY